MISAGAYYVDKPAVRDGNLVTLRVPGDLPEFATLAIEDGGSPRWFKPPGKNE